MRTVMVIVLILGALSAVPATARIQPDFICWAPDSEFPVDCEDDE